MKHSKSFLKVLTLISGLSLSACSTLKVENKRAVPENRKECFKIKPESKIQVSGFERTKVYWTEKAQDICPAPGFPLIQVEHPKVQNWIQVVETNQDPRPEGVEDASWNIFPGENTFTFIDVSEKYRKLHKVHNYHVDYDVFMDNPRAKAAAGVELVWVAHLYGMRDMNVERKSVIFGIEWGYRLKDGVVTPLRPKLLVTKNVRRDFQGLKSYLKVFESAPKAQ